jgi:hypothetical protein
MEGRNGGDLQIAGHPDGQPTTLYNFIPAAVSQGANILPSFSQPILLHPSIEAIHPRPPTKTSSIEGKKGFFSRPANGPLTRPTKAKGQLGGKE